MSPLGVILALFHGPTPVFGRSVFCSHLCATGPVFWPVLVSLSLCTPVACIDTGVWMCIPIPTCSLSREWHSSSFGFWNDVLNEVEKTANVSVPSTAQACSVHSCQQRVCSIASYPWEGGRGDTSFVNEMYRKLSSY